MNEVAQPAPSVTPPPVRPTFFEWLPWEKITIWGLFLAIVYTLRHFFFIFFMTFILTYIMRTIIVRIASVISPNVTRNWVERALAVLCYILLLFGLYEVGQYFGPKLVAQGQGLVGLLSRLDPKREFNNILSETAGAYLFSRTYGSSTDPRYIAAFEKFKQEGTRGVAAYQEFPTLEASIEGRFESAFQQQEAERIRNSLKQNGPSKEAFDKWLADAKAKEMYNEKRQSFIDAWNETYRRNHPERDSLEKFMERPGFESERDLEIKLSIVDDIKRNPSLFSELQDEWVDHEVDQREKTPEFAKRFREFYEHERQLDSKAFPYELDKYIQLKAAYKINRKTFGDALGGKEDDEAQLHADFVLAAEQELAQHWWDTDPAASLIRDQLGNNLGEMFHGLPGWLREAIRFLITVPVQVALSLMLSFFITFDIPNLKKQVDTLKHSRVSGFYEEIAPGLISFSLLMGRAFQAQGVIAFFNTLLTFLAIKFLGIQNEVFLCAIVFICSFIPVLGVVLSSVPIAIMAIIQPQGSVWLAIQGIIAILIIHFIETSVLNPKIIGDMLHLHPVIVLTVLAIGEHFFGVWGLLLGVPVTVYILRFVILDEGIPGFLEPIRHAP